MRILKLYKELFRYVPGQKKWAFKLEYGMRKVGLDKLMEASFSFFDKKEKSAGIENYKY